MIERQESRPGATIPARENLIFSLRSVCPKNILVAANLHWFRNLQRAVDEYGPDASFSTENVFPIDPRSEFELLKRTRTWVKLRVLDGPYAGRTGFSIPEAVRERWLT